MIVAEVVITGSRKTALAGGFRLLADYIFGNNAVQKSIKMTAPVQQQSNQKIAMTAPVGQKLVGTAWNISFVMLAHYTVETIAQPNNKKVCLKQIPSQKYAVIRFSGTNSDANIKKRERQLINYLAENAIKNSESPQYAFYNPPWTLPFLRRNEVMLQLND